MTTPAAEQPPLPPALRAIVAQIDSMHAQLEALREMVMASALVRPPQQVRAPAPAMPPTFGSSAPVPPSTPAIDALIDRLPRVDVPEQDHTSP